MARFIKDRSNAKGQVPGSLIFIGNQKMEKTIIQLMEYDSENLVEKELKSIDEAVPHIQSGKVTWINIYGIHDLDDRKNWSTIRYSFPPARGYIEYRPAPKI